MDLTIYNVILDPVLSDKAVKSHRDLKKIVLRVHPAATKPMIKEAMWRIFQVKVEKINTSNRQKDKRSGRRIIHGPVIKKATITLAPGYSLDMFGQAGTSEGLAQQTSGSTDKE